MITLPITDTISVHLEPIVRGGNSPRQAEQAAIQLIVNRLYSPRVYVAHHPDGSPFIADCADQISVSHCNAMAALLVNKGPGRAGVDIESTDRDTQLRRVAPRFLAPDELPYWTSAPRLLLTAWTLKEAAYKASRTQPADLRKIQLSADSSTIKIGQQNFRPLYNDYVTADVWCSVVISESD